MYVVWFPPKVFMFWRKNSDQFRSKMDCIFQQKLKIPDNFVPILGFQLYFVMFYYYPYGLTFILFFREFCWSTFIKLIFVTISWSQKMKIKFGKDQPAWMIILLIISPYLRVIPPACHSRRLCMENINFNLVILNVI